MSQQDNSTEKRIARSYRLLPLVDKIIKRHASALGTSEAEMIEMCVLEHALALTHRRAVLTAVAKSDSPKITDEIRAARQDLMRGWRS